ncbi:hypothetical protein SISSUDRAFT_1067672 [Sistotremastrum suecicum HHB10207 ss-3]|uniref:Uncharacterized protein n=1 Tax=Sistotremastrum suecicum HHB10207 ss-3 TaxID=1314776 RepID=A0A165WUZ0_9AGAM|nr:hypothetical protein SISSUDRAFT_1067672 [Sistotremastrum suecicum HHB10207 ss-3]
MQLTAPFIAPTYPKNYGSPKYHEPPVLWTRINSRSLLGDVTWLQQFYNYNVLSQTLRNQLTNLSPDHITSSICAMQRSAHLHGAASAQSHNNLASFPTTYLWDVHTRRRAGSELTELAFDSLAGLERTTGSLTLSVVMHGTLRPDKAWTRHDLVRKLSVWTGDSVYHDPALRNAWGDIIDAIVDRIAIPWQHSHDARFRSSTGSQAFQDPEDIHPLSQSPLKDWQNVHDALPASSQNPRMTPKRRQAPHTNSAPSPSPSPTKIRPSHARMPGATARPALTPSYFDPSLFTESFLDALLEVGWDADLSANHEALQELYECLCNDNPRTWPASIVKILHLPGTLVQDLCKAAAAGAIV